LHSDREKKVTNKKKGLMHQSLHLPRKKGKNMGRSGPESCVVRRYAGRALASLLYGGKKKTGIGKTRLDFELLSLQGCTRGEKENR